MLLRRTILLLSTLCITLTACTHIFEHNSDVQARQALLDLMEIHSSIVEINETKFSNVAYVTIKGEERSAFKILRNTPSVRFVARNQMILFCH